MVNAITTTASENGSETMNLRSGEYTIGKFGVEIECVGMNRITFEAACRDAGIEINFEHYNHTTRAAWKIVTDASLVGATPLEVVSPILEGDEGIAQMRKVVDLMVANGAKVNRSCGLHVHHDASDFTAAKLPRVLKTYQRIEKLVDGFMPISRRGNNARWCAPVAGRGDEITVNGANRYHKVNFQSWYRQGSVEFRHHSGTVDAEKIENWVLFTGLVMNVSRKTVRSNKEMTRWVDVKWHLGATTSRCDARLLNMVRYYEDRRKAFARRERRTVSRRRVA